jgi:endo-1,4-beta-xylanase
MRTREGIKAIGCVVWVSLVISGCGGSTAGQTNVATATVGTLPPNATTAPTPTPAPTLQGLADAPDLHLWIDDYVHAYGGTVSVDGVEENANQVLAAVRANPAGFIQSKTVKGKPAAFFVVNGVPLAMMDGFTWRAILARDISEAVDGQFAMPVLAYQIWNPDFVKAVQNANMLAINADLNNGVIFKTMTTQDWKNLFQNWTATKAQLDAGQIPSGITYDWSGADQIVQFARANHMRMKGTGLVWNGDVPDSIRHGGFSKADLLKYLEFTISVKLLRYKDDIAEWHVESELVDTAHSTDEWGFWTQNVGILDATRLSARLIRRIAPEAKVVIADDYILEEHYYGWQPGLGQEYLEFAKTLKQEGLVDRAEIENNMWIWDMPTQAHMEQFLRKIQALGIELAAPDLTVCPTEHFPTGMNPRKIYTKVDDPQKAMAEGYRRVVQAYLNVGATDIGLGDVGDLISWGNWLAPGTDMCLWDSEWKPKMGYYEILDVMYAAFIH